MEKPVKIQTKLKIKRFLIIPDEFGQDLETKNSFLEVSLIKQEYARMKQCSRHI